MRNTTLGSCLAREGEAIMQRPCTGSATAWRRKDTAGGFTLTSTSDGKCLSRGAATDPLPWDSTAVIAAPCGGQDQVWSLVNVAPGINRLANGDGWYLLDDWSGRLPVTLRLSSVVDVATQNWALEEATS